MSSDVLDGPIRERYAQLKELILNCNKEYYSNNTSPVPDSVFDGWMRELLDLERRFPALRAPDSPSQLVGFTPGDQFEKVTHPFPMQSLANVFSPEELFEWIATLPLGTLLYGDVKLDGVSLDLLYYDGGLIRALTRGDGLVGEDVTLNARMIANIPTQLPGSHRGLLVIRGEVVVHKDDFMRINRALQEEGKKTFANERNYASGSLRQKDPMVTQSRLLRFYGYGYHPIGSPKPVMHQAACLMANDFDIAPRITPITRDWGLQAIATMIEECEANRDDYPFQIDGLVFKVDDVATQEAFGSTSKEPRWAKAYKFQAQEGLSVLRTVAFQVGRTGKITPVAKIDPVHVLGTTITSPTLHNPAEIQRLGLHYGDTVVVKRAGDVIPAITQVIEALRPANAQPVVPPTACPECGSTLVMEPPQLFCRNVLCPGQLLRVLAHAVSRDALNIMGVGTKTLELLVRLGLVRSVEDLLKLEVADFPIGTELTPGEIQRIVDASHAARNNTLDRVLFAFGIPMVGKGTSTRLAKAFKTLPELLDAHLEELLSVDDVGEDTAMSILTAFTDPETRASFDRYAACFTEIRNLFFGASDLPLAGKSVVVTGSKVGERTRKEVEADLIAKGAKVTSNVTVRTWAVVAGTKATQHKLDTAKALEIPIITDPAALDAI